MSSFSSSSASPSSSSQSSSSSSFDAFPTHMKGVFCGSGSDAMNDPRIVQTILDLVEHKTRPQDINVVYLGTATFDINGFFVRQTQRFVEQGCNVQAVNVAGANETLPSEYKNVDKEELLQHYIDLILRADVIVVGGGNTLFALDRWRKLGIDKALRTAADQGAVLTGGSAGAIVWFQGGHSNSADPATYKRYRIQKFANTSPEQIVDEIYNYGADDEDDDDDDQQDLDMDHSSRDDSSRDHHLDDSIMSEDEHEPDSDDENHRRRQHNMKSWEYFRVSALGFFPGLVSPHLDRVQSNGVLRAKDFDKCLLKHAGENGIGIDHFAALVVDGPNYRVLSLEGKEGTVKGSKFVEDGSGMPGVWLKQVVDGTVVSKVCPPKGQLKDILKAATHIKEDKMATRLCRMANPDDGWLPSTAVHQ